jgi:glycerophosphoryl diester phosphodiesterase
VLEFDVHASRDGAIVVIHDATLERTTNGTGLVKDLALYELQQLDAGYHFTRDGRDFPYRGHGIRIPAFENVLKQFPLAHCNLEIKQAEPAIVAEVIGIIRQYDAQHRVLLAAEHHEIMEVIRRLGGDISTGFSAVEVADFVGRVQSGTLDDYRPAGRALQIPPRSNEIALVTAESVAAAHRCGLEMHVWTINQPDEMQQLLALGVDGIMSDLPGLALSVVSKERRESSA